MYQVVAVTKNPDCGCQDARTTFGSQPDRLEAIDYATSLAGTVEVVDERTGRLLGVSTDGEWTESTKPERRPVL